MADTNRLMLFRTIEKTKPNSPDWHGRGHIQLPDGKVYPIALAAWNKESERAGKYMSVSIDVSQEEASDPRDVINSRRNS